MRTRLFLSAIVLLGALGAASASLASPLVTSAGAANVANCASTQLRISHGGPQGTAGTTYVPIIITNRQGTCAIWGVPAIQPVNGRAHRSVGPRARSLSMGEMAARQVIAKGASVSVALGVVDTANYSKSTCAPRRANGVLVSLGAFFSKRFVALRLSVCTKLASTTTRLLSPGPRG